METGVTDIYTDSITESYDDACAHANVEFSHDTLAENGTDSERNRWYVIVDSCMDCGVDLQETAWSFRCQVD